MTENNNTFEFTYSAKEQAEIKQIREKYTAPEKKELTSIEKLRALDNKVTKKASAAALVFGILGALILGIGMSLIMTDFAAFIGFSIQTALVVGIVLGVVGIALVVAAYPVYSEVTKNERKKIAPEIIRITDELMK